MGKERKNFRIPEKMAGELETYAKETGTSQTNAIIAAWEYFHNHGEGNAEAVAGLVLKKWAEAYGDTLSKIKASASAADFNLQVFEHFFNTLAVHMDIRELVPADTTLSPVLQESRDKVREKISVNKQRKDNRENKK
jgi:hypothetical protein